MHKKCPRCGGKAYPWTAAFSDSSGWDCPDDRYAPGGCGWSAEITDEELEDWDSHADGR